MSQFLIFGHNYWPEPVGIAQYTTPYAEGLVNAGHQVVVVTGYPHYPAWSAAERRLRILTEDLNGVRVVRVPHAVPPEPTAFGRLRLEASYGVMAMIAAVRHLSFDATVGMSPALSSGIAAVVAGSARRKPSGVLVQDLMSAAASTGGVPGASKHVARAVRWAERLALRDRYVAVVSPAFAEPARALGARDITELPNFSLLGSPTEDRDATRARIGARTGRLLAMYSGNLGFKQDFIALLDAAELLREHEIDFLIIGEGSQSGVIEERIEERKLTNVRTLPLQPEKDLPNVLRAADITLAPQRPTDVDMSLPSKLTAYMSAGRAIITAASPESETARLVERSGAGVVVAPSDPRLIAAAIEELASDGARREALGRSGESYAAEHFGRERAIARFVAWAERIAARG